MNILLLDGPLNGSYARLRGVDADGVFDAAYRGPVGTTFRMTATYRVALWPNGELVGEAA